MNETEFAAAIKRKYPQYRDVPDRELVRKILKKYPQYQARVQTQGEDTTGAALTALAERGAPFLGPGGAALAAGVQALRTGDTPQEAAGSALRTGGAEAAKMGTAALGGGLLSKAPGAIGYLGRFLTKPGGDAAVAGAEELYRTGSPRRALGAAGMGYLAGKLGGGRPGRGILGRIAKAFKKGATEAVKEVAETATKKAAKEAAKEVTETASKRTRVTPSMRPQQKVIKEAAKTTREATKDATQDLLKLSQKLKGQPKLVQDMAAFIARLRREAPGLSASTPSGSPGQIATSVYDKYVTQVDGLTKGQAQKIVDMVLGALE